MDPMNNSLLGEPLLDAQWLPNTKLAPETTLEAMLDRSNLARALDRAVWTHRLTVLSAPFGYGKTSLLSLWWQSQRLREGDPAPEIAWLSLDGSENDRSQFLLALIAAIQTLNPMCGRRAKAFITTNGFPEPVDPATLSHIISGLLVIDIIEYLPKPFALVLDGYEHITEPTVHKALDFLIRRLPGHVHLVVSTIQEPPLHLPQLKAYGVAAEFNIRDLSLDEEETSEYAQVLLGEELPAGQLHSLFGATEGWPAGIALVIQSLQSRTDPSERGHYLAKLAGTIESGPSASDLDSVFHTACYADLPADLRRFLLQTSILPVLDRERCTAVSGRSDAPDLLNEVRRRNLFITRCGPNQWRYHRLFAAFLRRRLDMESPEQLSILHRRAAHAEPSPGGRIAHFLAAHLWDDAAQAILEAFASTEPAERDLAQMANWVNQLPPETRRRHPDLAVHIPEHPLPPKAKDLGLTKRQYQVIKLLAQEASNQDIAEELVVSLPTVKGHVSQILRKLEVTSRGEAVEQATVLGLLGSRSTSVSDRT